MILLFLAEGFFLAHRRYPPPLPAGLGKTPRRYSEESLLLMSLLRILWDLSYQDMHDCLKSWPDLALARGFPLDKEGTTSHLKLIDLSAGLLSFQKTYL